MSIAGMRNTKRITTTHPAIVLGMSANGLSVARALGEKNIKVIGVDHNPLMEGMYSRYLWKKYVCPDPSSDEFVNFLYTLGRQHPEKCIVFPTADEYLLPLSEYRDDFHRHFKYLLPSKEIVACFIDKEKTSNFAQKYEIPHPRTTVISTVDELDGAIAKVGFPCFFKPIISHDAKKHIPGKGFEAHTKEQCVIFFKLMHDVQPKVLLQEVISGGDENLYEFMTYCDCNSNLLSYFTLRKIRQYPPNFGIACLSESIENKDLYTIGKRIIELVNYQGLIHFEFKLDSKTNKIIFLEANLRTSFLGQLSISSGVNLPLIAYMNMSNGEAPQCPVKQRNGVKLLNITWDLGHFARARTQNKLTFLQWLREYNTLNIAHTYWRWNDPLPWAKVYSRFLMTLFHKASSYIFHKLSIQKKQ